MLRLRLSMRDFIRNIFIVNSFLIISTALGFSSESCSDLTHAKELKKTCVPGTTTTCTLTSGTVYKITETTGSASNLLPPIIIPKDTSICIADDKLSGAIDIYAQGIWIKGGLFQVGSQSAPITSANKVTVYMGGSLSASPAPAPLCQSDTSKCSTIAQNSIATYNARDITITNGGKLFMYGKKGLTARAHEPQSYIHDVHFNAKKVDNTLVQSLQQTGYDVNELAYFGNQIGSNAWSYLMYPAGPSYFDASMWVQAPVSYKNVSLSQSAPTPTKSDSPYLLVLAKDVTAGDGTDWQMGDWISVATTSFVSHQTEIVQICTIYTMANPDSETQTKSPNVSVIVLAGAPSFSSKCPTIQTNTPLKHYHFGSFAPTTGYFSSDQSYTNAADQSFNVKKGQAKSMYDSYLRNFGIDERAEVALLSRNIKLTSLVSGTGASAVSHINKEYFGGNIVVMHHPTHTHAPTATHHNPNPPPSEELSLVGVEIEKFGQPLVGRYPVHLHRLNSDTTGIEQNLRVQDSVVHHSFNKCYVTHDTMGAKFYNNVCVRAIGQGFYLEDGHNVADNHYVRNHVAGVMAAALNYDISDTDVKNQSGIKVGKNQFWDGDYLAQQSGFNYNPAKIPDTSNSGANTGSYLDSFGPSGFWITTFGGNINGTNYPNIFINNSVAGCQLRGAAYWLVRQDINDISQIPSTVQADQYPVFIGNRGHACYDGVMAGTNFALVNAGTGVKPIAAPPKPVPPGNEINTAQNAPFVIFEGLTLTQIQQKAFWYRGVFVGINNGRFSALKQGMTLLGGGGPEGNLLGFWGIVSNSVFAAVTNNNVSRYIDCEGYFESYGTGDKSFNTTEAFNVSKQNEMGQCAPINANEVSLSPLPSGIANNTAVFGDIYPNFNFQGYTFYDGPARMEDNRFINFRADPTNSTMLESINDQQTRFLVTKVDAHKMMDYKNVAQLGDNYTAGGTSYYGYAGDAAFSWLKGNQQSVPPTQYALGNIWENTNFKHQVFTEIANLQSPLQDGDKQTVEIDRDATLSGYKLCTTGASTVICSDSGLNHYPISLNNLAIFSTAYTTDEPDSRGRNNVADSALMSPHKYATVNIGVAGQNNINGLSVTRDMSVYGSEPVTDLTGRGGLKYMYEAMVMNNMGYRYTSGNAYNGQNKFLFSYSDAPIDSLFINRVGICVGTPTATFKKSDFDIKIYKAPRQWNSGVNYLQTSPYFTNGDVTDTASSCPSIVTSSGAFNSCKATAKALSSHGWGKVDAYAGKSALNQAFYNGIDANYKGNTTALGGLTEGYYYDKDSGMLYFNMIQYPNEYDQRITPPYGTCNNGQYNENRQTIIDYLAFANSDSIARILDAGCYASYDTNKSKYKTKTSELLTCPKGGCAVYTVEFTPSPNAADGCTAPSWAQIKSGTSPAIDATTSKVTYASPYALYQGSTLLSPTAYVLSVSGDSIQSARNFNYIVSTGTEGVEDSPSTSVLLPLSVPVYQNQITTINMHQNPSDPAITILHYGITPIPKGPIWTFNTGASATAGQQASISSQNQNHFQLDIANKYPEKTELTIKPNTQDDGVNFYYAASQMPSGATAMVSFGGANHNNNSCQLNFGKTSVSLASNQSAACNRLTLSGVTITVPAP